MRGTVSKIHDELFLKTDRGLVRFPLVAWGIQRLALLWLLLRSSRLSNHFVLFWDEPEANLNPSLIGEAAGVLLGLQRTGVQVEMATNSYLILEEIRLRVTDTDQVRFHSFYRDPSGDVHSETSADSPRLRHNAIFKAYDRLYDSVILKEFGQLGQ